MLTKIDERRVELIKKSIPPGLQSVTSQSWLNNLFGVIHEPFAGAWQRNIVEVDPQRTLLSFSAVYRCVTGISADVAKMRIKLSRDKDGIWEEITENQPWLTVLRKPNHYQNRIQFVRQWILSKLIAGNAYILKERLDKRGIVTGLYPLDPARVTPLVADNGEVYYQLQQDYLSGLEDLVTVPASEIIHDRMAPLFHPLVGVSPLYACAMSATMGNKIQANSTGLFGNMSRPGGIVMVPGQISSEQARVLKENWDRNYSGANVGKVAVLGDGMKFEPLGLTAEASQLAEQLGWTVQDVGRAFAFPAWKMGSGEMPPYSGGPQAATMMYYTDCLQDHVESLELCLDEGLELPAGIGTEMDLDNLMRMDSSALYDSITKMAGWGKIDEGRFRANLPKTPGGDAVYLQEQNYSLPALAKRDAMDNPFGSKTPAPTVAPAPNPVAEVTAAPTKEISLEDLEFFEAEMQKELCLT